MRAAKQPGEEPRSKDKLFALDVALAATHYGAGCCLGDIVAEWIVYFIPLVLFGQKGFRHMGARLRICLSVRNCLSVSHDQADAESFRWESARRRAESRHAFAHSVAGRDVWVDGDRDFGLFGEIPKTNPVFWFMMQIAMIAGFITSYPANWWLLKKGVKERM
jgi:Domain of unknown function (DUF4396)